MILRGNNGEYEIENLSQVVGGEGSFAILYKAKNLTDGNPVAIKILRKKYLSDPKMVKRFAWEGNLLLNNLKVNPHTIHGIDAFVDKDGKPYIVMEWAEKNLRQFIKERGGTIDVATSVEYARGMLKALDGSHQKGIYHTDIHPGNILFDSMGIIKLGDFGLARIFLDTKEGQEILRKARRKRDNTLKMDSLRDPHTSIESTVNGSIEDINSFMNDPNRFTEYMPPEQFDPVIRNSKDPLYAIRADLFAVSRIVNEMITGRKTGRLGLYNANLDGTNLEHIIEIAGDESFEIRPSSAKEMLKVLEPGVWDKDFVGRKEKKRKMYFVTAAVSAAIALGIIGLSYPHIQRYARTQRIEGYIGDLNRIEILTTEGNLSEAKDKWDKLEPKIRADENLSPEAKARFNEVGGTLLEKYRAVSISKEKRNEKRSLEAYDILFGEVQQLLSEKNYQLLDVRLSELKRFVDETGFESVISKGEVLDYWIRETYIPTRISDDIDRIQNIGDYKERKKAIDDLVSYCDSVKFKNKLTTVRQVANLHNKGISEEEKVLEGYYHEFVTIKNLTEKHYYKNAMQKAKDLVDSMNSSNLIYLDTILSRHNHSTTSLGRYLKEMDVRDAHNLTKGIQQYNRVNVEPSYNAIVKLEQQASDLFRKYDSLLKGNNVDSLIEADKELYAVICNLSRNEFVEYKELEPQFASYRDKVINKIKTIAKARLAQYEKEIRGLGSQAEKPNLTETEIDSLIRKLGSVKSEMEIYRQKLFRDEYLK